MDLNDISDLQLVASHGGFGKASRASGRSKATLSRRVADLEEKLGIRLIERGTQNLELTEAGQLLLKRVEGPMREISEAIASAKDSFATPSGVIRIAAPILFSQLAFGRIAAKFLALYPDVQIETIAEDRVVNLVDEHFDATIRINPSKDSELVGRCFAKDRLMLVSSPSLQMPENQADRPSKVPAVVMPSYRDGDLWTVNNDQFTVEPKPVLRLTSFLMVRDAIVAGAGAGMLPRSIINKQLESGELVAWGMAGNEVELWVLHTSRRLQSPKVRAFVEFMCKQYPDGVLSI